MTEMISINTIFNGLAAPTTTYVAQNNGLHEKQLKSGILQSGTLCLLTGSSKTGKTSLYLHVCKSLGKEPLIIRCSGKLTSEEFWNRPLEKLDFKRLESSSSEESTTKSLEGKIGGSLSWGWLAGLIGEVQLGISKDAAETEIRQKILSQPSPDHLIPLLKNSNAILIVEDFHYLGEETKKEIFQQWKSFTDQQVSIIVVGTTHHGVDLAYANPDLVGRIEQVDLGRWAKDDLEEIIELGFQELGFSLLPNLKSTIASESSGLPIITQQTCAQLFTNKDISEFEKGSSIVFNNSDVFDALNSVATQKYVQFESWYSRLKSGPRQRARKFDSYGIILSIFALDPMKFNLERSEIFSRISKLGLNADQIPPAASINSTLSALDAFQRRNGFELLEWSRRDSKLFVLEPAFLFFIRWRVRRTKTPTLLDAFTDFLRTLQKNGKSKP